MWSTPPRRTAKARSRSCWTRTVPEPAPRPCSTALGVQQDDFETGYRKYVDDVVKAAGAKRRNDKVMTFAELEAAQEDTGRCQHHGQACGRAGAAEQADGGEETRGRGTRQGEGPRIASVVKARLVARDKDEAGALKVLEEAAAENPDDSRVLLALGKAYLEGGQAEKAAAPFKHGRKLAPLDGDWLTELARIYASLKKDAELRSVLLEMAGRDPDDLSVRVKLARLSLKDKPAEAERFARDALFIDVMHEEARPAPRIASQPEEGCRGGQDREAIRVIISPCIPIARTSARGGCCRRDPPA